MDPVPPFDRSAAARCDPHGSAGRRAGRRDRLPVRRAVRRRRRALAVAGAARAARSTARSGGSSPNIPTAPSSRSAKGWRRSSGGSTTGACRWITVDVPEAIEVRERLLTAATARRRARRLGARPALDGRGRRLTRPADHRPGPAHVLRLRRRRAARRRLPRRFPGATLVFDAMPGWLSKASQRGRLGDPAATSRRRGSGAWTATSAAGSARRTATAPARARAVLRLRRAAAPARPRADLPRAPVTPSTCSACPAGEAAERGIWL